MEIYRQRSRGRTMVEFAIGNPGGPGRPKGSRNKARMIFDAIGMKSTAKAIEAIGQKAETGDRFAGAILLARTWARPRGGGGGRHADADRGRPGEHASGEPTPRRRDASARAAHPHAGGRRAQGRGRGELVDLAMTASDRHLRRLDWVEAHRSRLPPQPAGPRRDSDEAFAAMNLVILAKDL